MESLDLLEREVEFKKLNRQLDKKTKSLMKEIEHAMQKPDIFTDFSHSLILNTTKHIKKHCCESPKITSPATTVSKDSKFFKSKPQTGPQNCRKLNDDIHQHDCHKSAKDVDIRHKNCDTSAKDVDIRHKNCDTSAKDVDIRHKNCDTSAKDDCYDDIHQNCDAIAKNVLCYCCNNNLRHDDSMDFLYAFVSVNVKDGVLPQSFLRGNTSITVENVCKCLSAKIKLLQEQIDKLQNTIKKKTTQCESHLSQITDLESERMTLLNRNNNMKSSTIEWKTKCMALQKRFEEKDRLYKEQRSQADKLSSEIKHLRSKNAGVEAKCASQEEAVETLKHQLELARRAEKEFRDSSRTISASHESAISRLESQIKSLTTRIERQMALINNLRKQNAVLSTEGVLTALEKEYSGFLTQDF